MLCTNKTKKQIYYDSEEPGNIVCGTEMTKIGEIPGGKIKNEVTSDNLFALPKTLHQCGSCKSVVLN